MTDREFATEMVRRLNALLATDDAHPGVCELVGALVNHRVQVSLELARDHPTIQCDPRSTAGLVGVLNGICGVQSNGWGYVAATLEDDEAREFMIVGGSG